MELNLLLENNSAEPIKPTLLPRDPWQDLAVDLLGPLLSGDSVLVVVDYFSRFYETEVMRSTTSEKIFERLEEIFTTHGLPLSVTRAIMDHSSFQICVSDTWKIVV